MSPSIVTLAASERLVVIPYGELLPLAADLMGLTDWDPVLGV